jgi:hypothetical protein
MPILKTSRVSGEGETGPQGMNRWSSWGISEAMAKWGLETSLVYFPQWSAPLKWPKPSESRFMVQWLSHTNKDVVKRQSRAPWSLGGQPAILPAGKAQAPTPDCQIAVPTHRAPYKEHRAKSGASLPWFSPSDTLLSALSSMLAMWTPYTWRTSSSKPKIDMRPERRSSSFFRQKVTFQ